MDQNCQGRERYRLSRDRLSQSYVTLIPAYSLNESTLPVITPLSLRVIAEQGGSLEHRMPARFSMDQDTAHAGYTLHLSPGERFLVVECDTQASN